MPTTRSSEHHRPVLGYFVLGSLLLHALLVGLWQGEAPAGPSAHSTFQVTLLARHGDTESELHSADRTVNKLPRRKRTEYQAVGAGLPANRPGFGNVLFAGMPAPTGFAVIGGKLNPKGIKTSANKVSKRESRSAAETHRAAMQKTPSRMQQKQVNARNGSTSHGRHELTSAARYRKIRTALQDALLPHFDYPPLARRRGWQGRVNVGLHVAADGDLTRIRLVKSSGHALLDRAAVRNVTELRSIPHAARWLEGNGMDLVLPVRYQLAD